MTNFLQILGVSNQYTPEQFDKLKNWCESHIGEQYHFNGTPEQQYVEYLHVLRDYLEVFQPALQNHEDSIGGIPLFWYGIYKGYLNDIRQMSMDLNSFDKNHLTPLHIASFYAYPQTFEWLLTQGVDLTKVDKENKTALHHALYLTTLTTADIENTKLLFAKRLIALAPELLIHPDNSGTTPIHIMATTLVFSELLASVCREQPHYQELVDNYGNHPIHLAILNAPEIASWMLDNPAVSNIPLQKNHQYPIHMIAIQGSLNLMKKCCEHSVIEIQDDYLKTPLILAAEYQHPEIVNYLLEKGANPDHKDLFGKTYKDYIQRPGAKLR